MNPKRIIQQVGPIDGGVGAFNGDRIDYGARALAQQKLRTDQLQNLQNVHAGKYVSPWKSLLFAGISSFVGGLDSWSCSIA